MHIKARLSILLIFIVTGTYSQVGIPIYSDYLSDNYFLVHPSMAGASNCTKVRLTARKQWFDQDEAPELQTLSIDGRVTDRVGLGVNVFNDKNGYNSQKGVKFAFAYHLMFSRDEVDLNQLSFGIRGGLVQNQLNETSFTGFDPIITGQVQKDSYATADLGLSYNYLDFYAHATIQGFLEVKRDLYTDIENGNVRKYLLSAGYVFGDRDRILLEPSILFQLLETTREKYVDLNMKAYKNMDFGSLWAVMSFRQGFDGAEYSSGSGTSGQKLQYITPIVGLNYDNFMFAYTYSHVSGPIKFDTGGFHQITLGLNLFCKKERYDCNCPAIN